MLGGDVTRARIGALLGTAADRLGTRIEEWGSEKIMDVEKKRVKSAHMNEEVMPA